jgi:hypothetical protein
MFLIFLCNFVPHWFDLTAYCNLALFMSNSTFNLTFVDDGSVNVHVCVYVYVNVYVGTAAAQWLRCYTTNRKVAGSIPDGVIGFFRWHKSFQSHYGPGVDSASNRNEYKEYFLGVKVACAWGWQPYHHTVPLTRNLGTLTSWNPLGHSRPVTGLYVCIYACMHVCRYVWMYVCMHVRGRW